MALNRLDKGDLPSNIRVYKNGALFDKDKGRIVGLRPELAEKNTLITKENTNELLTIRLNRKRELLQAAANDAVERGDLKAIHGNDAWIAEIGYNMQKKATNIDDPKMVDAARFLLQETGLSDKAVQAEAAAPVVHTLDPDVVMLLRQIAEQQSVIPIRYDIEAVAE
jgi:hypothetical protein